MASIGSAASGRVTGHHLPTPSSLEGGPSANGPGRKGVMTHEGLVAAICELLRDSPFHGEGYRKLWARLCFAGIRTSRRRVLRLMREKRLLEHQRAGRTVRGPRMARSLPGGWMSCGAPT